MTGSGSGVADSRSPNPIFQRRPRGDRIRDHGYMIVKEESLHLAVFNILWAVAHIAHVLRKEFTFQPLVWIVLLACVLLIERPRSRVRLGFLAVAQICLFVIRLPATDNHMYIMFFVNAGILVNVIESILQGETWHGENVRSLISYVSLVLVVVYLAAAVAKLNFPFFYSDESCAVNMLYDATAVVGILPGDMPGIIDAAMPTLVAATEMAIPLLVIFKRTRVAGIITLVLFHIAISFSPTATALDFTIMLFAIVYVLLPPAASRHVYEKFIQARARIPRLLRGGALSMPVLLLFSVLVVLVWRLGTVAENRSWMLLACVSLIIGTLLVYLAIKTDVGREGSSVSLATIRPFQYAILGLLFFNVATPYLGIKTAGTFTMYSNLNTFDGQSNHFFIPRWSGRTLHDDLVEIVETSDEELDLLRKRNLRITWHELTRLMSRRPDTRISFIRDGELFDYERADQNPELMRRHPVLHKLVWQRPDDSQNPRCLW